MQPQSPANLTRMPAWIRQDLGRGGQYPDTARAVQGLNTVCDEARCPNKGECWSRGTATFMLLGDTCTRACGFCAVKTGLPGAPPDAAEPARVAEFDQPCGLVFGRDVAAHARTVDDNRLRNPT